MKSLRELREEHSWELDDSHGGLEWARYLALL